MTDVPVTEPSSPGLSDLKLDFGTPPVAQPAASSGSKDDANPAVSTVRRFFKQMLEGAGPTPSRIRTVRAAGEWPRMGVDDFFERLLEPAAFTAATEASAEPLTPSFKPSSESAGSNTAGQAEVFAGFIWSN